MGNAKTRYVVAALLTVAPIAFFYLGSEITRGPESKVLVTTLAAIPYVFFTLAAVQSFRLNLRRFGLASLLFLTTYTIAFDILGTISGRAGIARYQAIAVSLPLSLLLEFILPPGRLLQWRGLGLIAVTFGPIAAFVAAFRLLPHAELERFAMLLGSQWLFHSPRWILSDFSLIALLLCVLVSFRQKDRGTRYFSLYLIAALIPVFFFLNQAYLQALAYSARSQAGAGSALAAIVAQLADDSMRFDVRFAALITYSSAGLLFLYGLYRYSWEKMFVDKVTGILNRASLEEALEDLSTRYTIAMVDIDHFKLFNDTHGHAEGDRVLRAVGQHLEREFPGCAFRYGGEEFCLVFDRKHLDEVFSEVDAMRRRLTDQNPGITVSVGLASRGETSATPASVRKAADRALYEAKQSGRNRVVRGAS